MEASTYYATGTPAAYAAQTNSPPNSATHPTAAAVSHSHPHHTLLHSHPHPQHSSLSQQQLSLSHPHSHPHQVMFASMHPMAPHAGWMTPTTAFMPAGPTMAYGAPHAAMYGQWHPHSHMQHIITPAHSSSNNSNSTASASHNSSPPQSAAAPSSITQRPIPQYATPTNHAIATPAAHSQLTSTPQPQQPHSTQPTNKGKKLKATAINTTVPAAQNTTASASSTPAPVTASSGVTVVPVSAVVGSVQQAGGQLGELSYLPSADLHTAEGRLRLMSDIRAMINDRKRNDVKRRYLAMKDKQTALDSLIALIKQQIDDERHTESALADRKQQLLDALMHYEGKRWIEQQGHNSSIASKTGRWVVCGRRKDNGEVCSHPVKRAKKGQTQKHCKHHQSRIGPALQ